MNSSFLQEAIEIIETNGALKKYFTQLQLEKFRAVNERVRHQNKFRIVFCGMFSSGKTSLINNILSVKDFALPTGINPVTKMITRLVYGERLTCSYISQGAEFLLSEKETFEIIQGRKIIKADNDEIIITLPSELLKHDVEIIDTPGFEDEMDGKLERMSRIAIPQSDMAVVCCNATKIGDMNERALIQDIQDICGHFILAITRIDHLSEDEDRNDALATANRIMDRNFDNMQNFIFPVVAAGKFKSTGNFENYILKIARDENLKRKISKSSCEKSFASCRRDICEKINCYVLPEFQEQLQETISYNEESIRTRESERSFKELKLQNNIADIKNYADSQIDYHKSLLNAEIEKLIKEFDVEFIINYQRRMNIKVKAMISSLINQIDAYAQGKNITGLNIKLGNVLDFCSSFSVPDPVRKKSRGLIGRTIFTAFDIIDNLISFTPDLIDIDDGYEISWNDCPQVAMKSIEDGPIKYMREQLRIYLDELYSDIRIQKFSILGGYEREIRYLKNCIEQCKKLKSISEQHIVFGVSLP